MDKSISVRLEEARAEREILELEKLRRENERERQREAQLAQERNARLDAYKYSKMQAEAEQSRCPHRKGGLGVEGFAHGDDSKYAIVRHRLSSGEVICVCQRCLKVWHKGDSDYDRAMSYPTDNVESRSIQFTFERNGAPVAA